MNKCGVLVACFLLASPAIAQLIGPTLEQKSAIVSHILRAHNLIDGNSNPSYARAYELERSLEEKMGLLGGDGQLTHPPTPDDLKKISGGWFGHDYRGDYARAVTSVQQAHAESNQEYQTALNMTMTAYGIPHVSGVVINAPPWHVGHDVSSAPHIDFWTPNKPADDLPGRVGADGSVYITPFAFFNHADISTYDSAPDDHKIHGDPDPGYLASILYHEYMHVQDALSSPEKIDLHNDPVTEVRHRLTQLLDENIFQVPSHDFLADLKSLVVENDLISSWSQAMQHGYDPYNENYRGYLESLDVTPQRRLEIRDQVNHDARELMSVADASDPASLENLREEAQTDFLKNLNDAQLGGLVSAWKKSLRVDAVRAEMNRRIFMTRMANEVASCGFVPKNDNDGTFNGTFLLDSNGWLLSYSVQGAMSEEQYKVGVMIAATCVAMTRDHRFNPPCNGGLAIASAYAGDPGFKSGIHFSSQSPEQTQCIQDISNGLRSQMSAQDYYDLSRRALEDYNRNMGNIERQDEQGQQNPQNSGGSSGGSGGVWRPHPSPQNPGNPQPPAPGQCWFEDEKAVCN